MSHPDVTSGKSQNLRIAIERRMKLHPVATFAMRMAVAILPTRAVRVV
jgi:hypothetical protein